MLALNPESTDLINLNFQPLKAVPRYRDPQLQFTKKIESAVYVVMIITDLRHVFFKSWLYNMYNAIKTYEDNTKVNYSSR